MKTTGMLLLSLGLVMGCGGSQAGTAENAPTGDGVTRDTDHDHHHGDDDGHDTDHDHDHHHHHHGDDE